MWVVLRNRKMYATYRSKLKKERLPFAVNRLLGKELEWHENKKGTLVAQDGKDKWEARHN